MQPKTILIADRQISTIQALTSRLRAAGYLVAAAQDGKEAYALARTIRPDLVVAEYQMPRLSGPELCVKLGCDPLTAHIPVIMMTAGGIRISSTAGNIVRTIQKPFNPQTLLDAVHTILNECALVGAR